MSQRDELGERLQVREQKLQAAYAFPSQQTRGRRHSEPAHRYRGPFQRDRDRILHSAAFRRLSGKMQVFTGDFGDYHRTRLTHTMEVASVARTIGRALGLNEDLIESLALFHDLGHPPFGHAGEDALAECLADDGGFSHNAFAITLVEHLEQRYADFPGLNLSLEVLEGQQTRIDKHAVGPAPLLEVQTVEAADAIAYNAHDVDDALKLDLVTWGQLQSVPLLDRLLVQLRGEVPLELRRQEVVRRLLDLQVGSLMTHSGAHLSTCRWSSWQDAAGAEFRIEMEPQLVEARKELSTFLYRTIYRHERLIAVRQRAQDEIRWLFGFFGDHPEQLPEQFRARIEQVGTRRSVGDYLAGMTDRFCREQYQKYRDF